MAVPLSPAAMVATSMHAQPGVYALLLGSGVSTGAGMPTGWGIVSDLVCKVAAQEAGATVESAREDPEAWWLEHHEESLGYSTLLESLAPTAAARQGILEGYFEPSEGEREAGEKSPSAAHKAIARLVKKGYIKVIVTTNFDRLIERALEAEGVAPQVISRPEAIQGMQPLPHASATVIKLHGDYKDLNSLNTPSELGDYPLQWKSLIERILDEYGLIISGWSADWDTALVAQIESNQNRRYPLYWDSRSSKGDNARRLMNLRAGFTVPASGADELFTELLDNVEALEDLSENPLTLAMATARLKRYLPDPVRRIDLHDLVMSYTDPVVDLVLQQPVVEPPGGDPAWYDNLFAAHRDATYPLLELLVNGVWHDNLFEHSRLWVNVVQRLIDAGTKRITTCTPGLENARLYPALLAAATIGLTSVQRGDDRLILEIDLRAQGRPGMGHETPVSSTTLLHPQYVVSEDVAKLFPRWGGDQWINPASHLLRFDLRSVFKTLVSHDEDWKTLFDVYEYRLALLQARNDPRSVMWGEWMGHRVTRGAIGPLKYLETSFLEQPADSLQLWMDYFNGHDQLSQTVRKVEEVYDRAQQSGRYW